MENCKLGERGEEEVAVKEVQYAKNEAVPKSAFGGYCCDARGLGIL